MNASPVSPGKKMAVIGGGVMGLVLAYRLSKAGYRISLFESQEQIGGLSTWLDYGDFVWDKYYHVILKQDVEIQGLIEELGLAEKLQWRHTSTGFLWKGRLIPLSNHQDFLRFPALGAWDKLRLAAGILYSHYWEKPENLEGLTAGEWLRRVFGKAVYEAIWDPLLQSKYGVIKDKIPAFMLWSTIHRYFGTRSKSGSKEWMGYLQGSGLKSLLEGLQKIITENGGSVHCLEPVIKIEPRGQVILRTQKGSYAFDRVVSTLPSFVLQRIYEGSGMPGGGVKPPAFLGVIRLALVSNTSLSPFYVTNLIDRHHPFTGIIELSRVVDREEFQNKTLIMLPRYDLPDSEWFHYSDEEIARRFLSSLGQCWAGMESSIERVCVHREKIVQAVWMEASPPKRPWISPDERIWGINAELSGYDVLNNNAIIRVANHYAKEIIGKGQN